MAQYEAAATPAHGNVNGRGLQNRWIQLAIGVVCMGLVANLQYGWTLFVSPMDARHHWGALGPIAKDYGFASMPVTLLGLTLPLLTMTLSIDNLCNGFTRPLCGFLSDKFARAGISAKVLLAPMRRRFITGQAEGLQVADAAYLPRIQREGD